MAAIHRSGWGTNRKTVYSLLPPVMGSMVESFATPSERIGHTEPLFRLYITGDTLVFDELQQIPKRFPTIDQALLHLGGTRALGVLVTMDGKQGVEMLRNVRRTYTQEDVGIL